METWRETLLARLSRLGYRAEDLRETFRRSRGPGGQHVNKVETGVVLEHLPTGVRAVAEESRSRSQNRLLALQRLIERLENQQIVATQERRAAAAKRRRQLARRSRKSKAESVASKRHRQQIKGLRRRPTVE